MSTTRRLLIALNSVCLVAAGAILLILLIHSHDFEYWVVVSQCVALICILLTGMSCLLRAKWAYTVAAITVVVLYIVVGISLAIGNWAWGAVINSGSSYNSLAVGSHIVRDGDLNPVRIDVRLWIVEMVFLSAAASIALRAVAGRSRLIQQGTDR